MPSLSFWLESSLVRVYPASPARSGRPLDLAAARGERVSFQACLRNDGALPLEVRAAVDAPEWLETRVRRVGWVPMAHHNTDTPADELEAIGHVPGLVPDPLFDDETALVGPYETAAFWVTVIVPVDAPPGAHVLTVAVSHGSDLAEAKVSLAVSPVVTRPPDFPVTHWFYADALCDWYHVAPYDERFWRIVRPYMQDLVDHGGSCQYVPLFTPPTDGVKRPHQLVGTHEVRPGVYSFDFSDVSRWVRLAQACGARWFEWTHLFTQWGVRHAIRVYRDNVNPSSLLWPPDTEATSPIYRSFLAQFLPEFHRFLEHEGLLANSFFHVSDEPHVDHLPAYRAAREMLRDLAPWMRVADAQSDVEFGKLGLTDIPIASIAAARSYAEAGVPAWAYFCCGPRGRYLNRLMDTPLAKIRMAGWLFHRFQARGFLHWGYNYWYRSQTQELIDPFREQAGGAWPGWPYGDPFQVYPGPAGPLDSVRWEVWGESLQDLALLKALGVDPSAELLTPLRGYDDFPKTPDWIAAARRSVLGIAQG